MSETMLKARKLVEDHIEFYGMVPHPDKLKESIARALEALQAENAKLREVVIEECVTAARDGFEKAMDDYVLIGPSGMAMQMINSIKALVSYSLTSKEAK